MVPLAGSDAASVTLLSAVGFVLLSFFDPYQARALRLVCREFVDHVRKHPWKTMTLIKGSIAKWRASFPRALRANVRGKSMKTMFSHGARAPRTAPVVDADFVHFEGLRELLIDGQKGITDAAFAHLRGIRKLSMSECSGITDAGFAHLDGIQVLDMSWCSSSRSRTLHLCTCAASTRWTLAAATRPPSPAQHLRTWWASRSWSCGSAQTALGTQHLCTCAA